MKLNNKLSKAKQYKSEQDKLRNSALNRGVDLIAPETIFLSKDTKFGKNITIEPYVVIGLKVKIRNNVNIKSFSHIEGTIIENNVDVGPYARLRPGTILKSGAKIGNFVETKKSKIGAGTITCNYDGVNKNKTNISDNVFIGSNTSLVAPVKINKNSTVGAGSVITRNVNSKSLALTRVKQTEIKNYKRKKKK